MSIDGIWNEKILEWDHELPGVKNKYIKHLDQYVNEKSNTGLSILKILYTRLFWETKFINQGNTVLLKFLIFQLQRERKCLFSGEPALLIPKKFPGQIQTSKRKFLANQFQLFSFERLLLNSIS